MRQSSVGRWVSGCIALYLLALSGGAQEIPPSVQPWLRKYCWECHDSATAKGGFSAESLKPELGSSDLFRRWVRVHDEVAAGRMPPDGKPQPSQTERGELVAALDHALTTQNREQQDRGGRVPVRRLSRAEYRDTIQDLLGVTVFLDDLLPEDAVVGGFDKLSAGLETSSHHLLRYQQAADRVVAAAFPSIHPDSQTKRMTGKEWYRRQLKQGGEVAALALPRAVRLERDAAFLYQQSASHPFLTVSAGSVTAPGRYVVRASLAARSPSQEAITVLLALSGYDPISDNRQVRILGVKDVEGTDFTTVEFQVDLPHGSPFWPGRSLELSGWTLPTQPHPDALKAEVLVDRPPDFTGPALGVRWVELIGPVPTSGALIRDVRSLPKDLDGASSVNPQARLRKQVEAWLPLAFRGVTHAAEVEFYLAPGLAVLNRGGGIEEAERASLRSILCAPQFWLRLETPGLLTEEALASRLSYFLWNSMPDPTLLERAAKGTLRNPATLREEVERMLHDPKAERFVAQWTAQWLDLRKLYDTKPDLMYGEFDDLLLWSMPQETGGFFREMLRADGPVTDWVDANWTFLNARLAQHYAIPGVKGSGFRRVSVPKESHRGGLLTQAAILKVTANGTSTSPVLRGKWVLEKIFAAPPDPPPPGVVALEPDIRGATTIREQLDKHRHEAACARCHRQIDPPGFALENFDVIGGWRDWYRVKDESARRSPLPAYPRLKAFRGPAVEAGFVLPDGRSFGNVDEYRKILARDPDLLARGVLTHLITYATGSPVEYVDRQELDQMIRDLRGGRFGFRSMIHRVVESPLFQRK